MDKRKTPVVKSNSTSEAKKNNSSTQKNNKKSQSNAEFQARITVTDGKDERSPVKRRGVYVEKKSIKIPLNNIVRTPEVRINSPKIHRRIPRPDKKRFLTNVLTLLSKATVGTQSFADESAEKLAQMENTEQRLKKKREEFFKQKEITSPVLKRKHRYKSNSLKYPVNSELDSLIVLQSTKEIIQTPSDNSVAPTHKNTDTHFTEPKTQDLAHPISHRHDLNKENNAPKASHSKRNKTEEHTVEEITNREEKNIYNFFVNVLQSTLSNCEVKPEFEVPASVKSSKLAMEIDEAIAKKLNMEHKEIKPTYEVSNNPSCSSKCFYVDVANESRESVESFKPELKKQYKTEINKKRIIRQNINTGALIRQYRLAAKKSVPETKTVPIPRKKTPRKKGPTKPKPNHRRDFIDSLKQELQFHQEEVYEKPSFFQALKVIAKNKKKQSVNFRTSDRKPSDENICQLKCRKVLSAKSSTNKRIPPTRQPNPRQTTSSYKRRQVTILEKSDDSMHSNYSLEVVDYDESKVKSAVKSNVIVHHPTDIISDEDFNFPVLSFSSNCCNVQIVA